MNSRDVVIELILASALARCAGEPLGLLLEDALKMHLFVDLLAAGHEIQVGAHNGKIDRVIRRAPSGGAVAWTDVDRATRKGRHGDIVVSNVGLAMELKVFGEVGSKDYPDKTGCKKDLDRVAAGTTDAALFVVAGRSYEAMRGDTSAYKLKGAFPEARNVESAFSDHSGLAWNGEALVARAAKVAIALNGGSPSDRLVVCIRRAG